MKLKKEFERFHNNIKASYTDTLISKKEMFEEEVKNKLPGILAENGICINKSDIEFFLQGSYATHTTIKTVDNNIDLDLAIAIPLDIAMHQDCRKIKSLLRKSIDSHNRKIEIKKPCITVTYLSGGEEIYHIDFPLYAKCNEKYYLAKGKEFGDYEWEECDPKGLNEYFRKQLAGNDQLRRIIRYLKKWKLNVFNNSNEMPPSIAMCIFACQNFSKNIEDGEHNDLNALYTVVKALSNKLDYIDDDQEIQIKLPTCPWSDTMFKINSNKDYRIKFKAKIKEFEFELHEAIKSTDDYSAAEHIRKVLGDEFDLPEKNERDKYGRTKQFG